MISLICSIVVTVNAGGIPVMTKADVEGKLVKGDGMKAVVDFSEGVKKFDLIGKPEDYKRVLVDRGECVRI